MNSMTIKVYSLDGDELMPTTLNRAQDLLSKEKAKIKDTNPLSIQLTTKGKKFKQEKHNLNDYLNLPIGYNTKTGDFIQLDISKNSVLFEITNDDNMYGVLWQHILPPINFQPVLYGYANNTYVSSAPINKDGISYDTLEINQYKLFYRVLKTYCNVLYGRERLKKQYNVKHIDRLKGIPCNYYFIKLHNYSMLLQFDQLLFYTEPNSKQIQCSTAEELYKIKGDKNNIKLVTRIEHLSIDEDGNLKEDDFYESSCTADFTITKNIGLYNPKYIFVCINKPKQLYEQIDDKNFEKTIRSAIETMVTYSSSNNGFLFMSGSYKDFTDLDITPKCWLKNIVLRNSVHTIDTQMVLYEKRIAKDPKELSKLKLNFEDDIFIDGEECYNIYPYVNKKSNQSNYLQTEDLGKLGE